MNHYDRERQRKYKLMSEILLSRYKEGEITQLEFDVEQEAIDHRYLAKS